MSSKGLRLATGGRSNEASRHQAHGYLCCLIHSVSGVHVNATSCWVGSGSYGEVQNLLYYGSSYSAYGGTYGLNYFWSSRSTTFENLRQPAAPSSQDKPER